MERFTGDISKLREQIRIELLDYELESLQEPIFTYYEAPHIMDYAYSFNYSKNPITQEYRLIRKEWNSGLDSNRFRSGVYNLDRLTIICDRIKLSRELVKKMEYIENREMKTQDHNLIVLDGLVCELHRHLNKDVLKWNIDQEMNIHLELFIKEIRGFERKYINRSIK